MSNALPAESLIKLNKIISLILNSSLIFILRLSLFKRTNRTTEADIHFVVRNNFSIHSSMASFVYLNCGQCAHNLHIAKTYQQFKSI